MCITTLLRRRLWGDDSILDTHMYNLLGYAHIALCNLSELPECQVPLARRTDVIDQVLAIVLHPAYDYENAETLILNLVQSPEAHTFIVRREVMEKMFEICEQRHKMVNHQTQQGKKENMMVISVLRCYTSIMLAKIGLGSPHLLFDSIPPHLLRQILDLMSDVVEAAS